MSISKIITRCLLLLWCSFGIAQNSVTFNLGTGETGTGGQPYVGTLTVTPAPTYSVCGSSQASSYCWQIVSGAPALNSVSAAIDGDLWGVNTSNVLFHDVAGTWKSTGIASVQAVATGNGTVYSLTPSGTIYYYNGSSWTYNKFSPYPTHFSKIDVGIDGDVWAIGEPNGCGNRVYHRNQSNNTWVAAAQDLTDISVLTASDVWGVCSTSQTYQYDGSNWRQDTGIGAAHIVIAGGSLSTGSGGTLFAGTGDFWYRAESSMNGYMTHLTGAPTSFAAKSEGFVYGLFGTTLKRFQSRTLQYTHNVAGQYNSDGCVSDQFHTCPNIYHTGPMSLQIAGHTAKTTNFNVLMTDSVNQNLSDTLTPTEAFQCEAGGSGCPTVTAAINLSCSVIGAAFMTYQFTNAALKAELPYIAHTRVMSTGKIFNCEWGPTRTIEYCDVQVQHWCTPETTPPDMKVYDVRDVEYPVAWDSWDVDGVCEPISFLGNTIPICYDVDARELTPQGAPPPPTFACTKNGH